MTMALAVALVACQAATSVKGEQGAQGAQGQQGPAGPPGTLDNEPPMLKKALDMGYLALAGSGKMDKKTIDLDKHFMDKENATLSYQAASSDKTVATYEIKDRKSLIVTGKGAGTATITVSAYDGVTADPTTSSFDVMVVASNAKPFVMLHGTSADSDDSTVLAEDNNPSALIDSSGDGATRVVGEQEKLRTKLYRTNVRGKTTIRATIHAGDDPFDDSVSFDFFMGKDGPEDNIVDVKITPKSGVANMWEVELTPIKSGMQNVYVEVTDKFGAPAETPADAATATAASGDTESRQSFQFVAFVNTIPSLDVPLADKTIVGTGNYEYMIASHFDTDEVPATAGPKIGKMNKLARPPGGNSVFDANGDGTETESGLLDGGFIIPIPDEDNPTTGDRLNDATCEATSSDDGVASVARDDDDDSTNTMAEGAKADRIRVTGIKAGKTIITITCRDDEDFAIGTATVTVRAAR